MWLPCPSAITRLTSSGKTNRPSPPPARYRPARSSRSVFGRASRPGSGMPRSLAAGNKCSRTPAPQARVTPLAKEPRSGGRPLGTMDVTVAAPTPILLGYADRFSVEPGETIRFMVSCAAPSFGARLVRLIHGDNNPAGPGYREEAVPSPADGTYQGQAQIIAAGSYARVPLASPLDLAHGLTVQAWVWPTTPTKPAGQVILACWSNSPQRGFVFGVDGAGHPYLELGSDRSAARVTDDGPPLDPWRWAFIAATYDPITGRASVYQSSAEPNNTRPLAIHQQQLSGPITLPPGEMLIAARELDADHGPHEVFNGKIDRPKLFNRALDLREIELLQRTGEPLPPGVLAAWDLSVGIGSDIVHDASSYGRHGVTVNLPTRAVTDHTWSGTELNWTNAPAQYAAIHFHDDDLDDARWQPSFELVVPDTLRSGVYAMHLEADPSAPNPSGADPGEEHIPFFVRPKSGAATAPVAFLAPTLTYMAYANERLYWTEGYREKRPLLTPLTTEPPDVDQYMAEHRELGLSLYDVHSDGSGCSYSSRLRPILNMRPKYRAWRLQDAPRHFAADLYLIGWLEACGLAYDVLTDEDLHQEGSGLLAGYRAILTGGHPEYYTEAMHTGFRQYLDGGGRLMYLGGNGFYWVTTVDPEQPHVIELRRGISGTRAWESSPGEWYHSTTGEFGGLWRLRGWAPQRLVGVGFAAQGWGGAAGYRRLPASHDPRVSFIFEGIANDEIIGD